VPIVGADGAEVGRHFRETGDGTSLGFDVRAAFYQRMLDLGGATATGYPISTAFRGVDGCLYQAFQVVLLQQCGASDVQLANTFEILRDAGADPQLDQLGIGQGETDGSATFADAVRVRTGWLDDAALRARYLSQCGGGDVGTAVDQCGLPMNHPHNYGPFVSQRFQRIAFQHWLTDGPAGISAGDVTAILGGDLLKQTGVLSGPAVRPYAFGQAPLTPVVRFGAATAGQAEATATPAPGAAPTPFVPPSTTDMSPRSVPLSFGFQGDFQTIERRRQAVPLVTGAGFSWVKQQIVWANFEMTQDECRKNGPVCLQQTVNGTTKYFWKNQLDDLASLLDYMHGNGLNVVLSIVRAPDFYAAPQGVAPSDPTKLRDFLQALVTYPSLKGKINAIEPWNEQNLSWEWGGARLWPNAPAAPPQGVVDFVALQKAAYQGIKAGDAGITVILPALTPTGVGECWRNPDARGTQGCLNNVRLAIDDVLYLEFVFSVNDGEIKQYYDVLGAHPSGYNNPPDDWIDVKTVPTTSFKNHGSFYIKRYRQLRAVQERFGDTKPMWITEVGWSSTRRAIPGYEYGQDNSEEQRGKYIARLLEQVNNEAPYVTNLFVWNLNLRTVWPETDERYGFGIIDANGSPLPAYTCAADFVRSGNRITRPECRS
jgi:hypothetical protein